ncbi:unnamed protein product [Strongylus vulgaris]|uniref:Uncharacterized protein n=1 Tax=Strongylus vulgaris TaxID=40348 RepID=A0A3P7IT38_STRVU|nr:unnamed protein product [Strongylus vulgaris]
MNIEELAKETDKAKTPAKKKGYDDVEISDLSDEDEKKSKKLDLKPPAEVEMKKGEKKEKKEKKEPRTETKTRSFKSEVVQQKTPVFKTVEEKEKNHEHHNIMSIPKYTGPISAGSGSLDVTSLLQ